MIFSDHPPSRPDSSHRMLVSRDWRFRCRRAPSSSQCRLTWSVRPFLVCSRRVIYTGRRPHLRRLFDLPNPAHPRPHQPSTIVKSTINNQQSEIHLIPAKTAAKRNLGKAVWRDTLATNDFPSEISKPDQIQASSGAFFLTAFQLYPNSLFFPQPPLPRPPVFAEATTGRLVFPNGSFRGLPQKAKPLAPAPLKSMASKRH